MSNSPVSDLTPLERELLEALKELARGGEHAGYCTNDPHFADDPDYTGECGLLPLRLA